MAGVAIALNLLNNGRSSHGQSLHWYRGVKASLVASSAAASLLAAGVPGYPMALLRDVNFQHFKQCSSKGNKIELDDLFIAFESKGLAHSILRSFCINYVFYLDEHYSKIEEGAEYSGDFPAEDSSDPDLVVPFKLSLLEVIRETTVITTRRVIERLVLHYAPKRVALKLLKDLSKSAVRKDERRMPKLVYFFSVCRMTFRGCLINVAVSWFARVAFEFVLLSSFIRKEGVDEAERVQHLSKMVQDATVRSAGSLLFASIGGGIGALFDPSRGLKMGRIVGLVSGSHIVPCCFNYPYDRFFS